MFRIFNPDSRLVVSLPDSFLPDRVDSFAAYFSVECDASVR
jgi:hypothetical protein